MGLNVVSNFQTPQCFWSRVIVSLSLSLSLSHTHTHGVFGAKYVKRKRYDCQLHNFILGQAKLAVYTSRKNKIEQKSGQDVVLFSSLVKARVLIDLHF